MPLGAFGAKTEKLAFSVGHAHGVLGVGVAFNTPVCQEESHTVYQLQFLARAWSEGGPRPKARNIK